MWSSFRGGKCSMPSSAALKPTTVPRSNHDTAPDPHHPGLVAAALLVALRAYKVIVSPYLPGACRFTPTCADYAAEAVRAHGAMQGSWLAVRRVARCRPWGGHGVDPIPQR
jgi:uncharacterized protein